jgi:hypothetical protein
MQSCSSSSSLVGALKGSVDDLGVVQLSDCLRLPDCGMYAELQQQQFERQCR